MCKQSLKFEDEMKMVTCKQANFLCLIGKLNLIWFKQGLRLLTVKVCNKLLFLGKGGGCQVVNVVRFMTDKL